MIHLYNFPGILFITNQIIDSEFSYEIPSSLSKFSTFVEKLKYIYLFIFTCIVHKTNQHGNQASPVITSAQIKPIFTKCNIQRLTNTGYILLNIRESLLLHDALVYCKEHTTYYIRKNFSQKGKPQPFMRHLHHIQSHYSHINNLHVGPLHG